MTVYSSSLDNHQMLALMTAELDKIRKNHTLSGINVVKATTARIQMDNDIDLNAVATMPVAPRVTMLGLAEQLGKPLYSEFQGFFW